MRASETLFSLTEMGIIQEVVRPLMSGKEAQLYLVIAGGEERVAKVYKDATQRSFQRRTDYTDGRQVRNSRDRRAMAKGSRHGRAKDEAAWRSAEVDIIYRLREAGVRVPEPYNYMDGVLIMELVKGSDGLPAPRLGDIAFTPEAAQRIYDTLIQEVVRMLCAGVVHGDLSEFNVLMGPQGPVIIDFPQAVDPASNSNARRLLVRDVENLHQFLAHSVVHPRRPYAEEMWRLFERNELLPETKLGGQFRDHRKKANTKDVLGIIGDAERDQRRRRAEPSRSRGSARSSNASRSPRGQASGPVVEMVVRSSSGRAQRVRTASSGPEPAQPSRRLSKPTNKPTNKPTGTPTENDVKSPSRSRRRRKSRGDRQARADGTSPGSTASGSSNKAGPDSPDLEVKKRRRRRRRGSSSGSGGSPDGNRPPKPSS